MRESSGKFSAADRCPAYTVADDIAAAVRDKQHRDEVQTAELINRGTPALPVRMGVDGGMNPTFLSAVKSHGGPGATIRTAAGTIPAHVNPPGERSPDTGSMMSLASAESKPVPGPRSSVQVASAAPGSSGGIGAFFGNLFGQGRRSGRRLARIPVRRGLGDKVEICRRSLPAPLRKPPARSPSRDRRRPRRRLRPNLRR